MAALEESDYSIFSDTVQVKGFIKNYARLLGLNEDEVMAFWRREYKSLDGEPAEEIKNVMKPLFAPKVVITPGLVLFTVTFVAILGFFIYLYFQYRSFAGAPFLAIESPSTDISLDKNSIDVFGKVDTDSELFLNGQKISPATEGSFAVTVSLSAGVNTLTFRALNKLGKESLVTRNVLVSSPNLEPVLGTSTATIETGSENIKDNSSKRVNIEIEILDLASWISVVGDNEVIFPGGVMLKGVKAIFSAEEFITIKAGNAGVVKVYLNSKDIGVLGKEYEVVEKTFRKD